MESPPGAREMAAIDLEVVCGEYGVLLSGVLGNSLCSMLRALRKMPAMTSFCNNEKRHQARYVDD